jgi:hypothetical protein
MENSFQRLGSESNAQVGRDFELVAQRTIERQFGVLLKPNLSVPVGIGDLKKSHAFDLGCEHARWIVECKSHRWTAGHNVPSAKMTVWNEAMYYFLASPRGYRKVLFVLRDLRRGNGESLAEYYLRTYGHLVPDDVEVWEFDETNGQAQRRN